MRVGDKFAWTLRRATPASGAQAGTDMLCVHAHRGRRRALSTAAPNAVSFSLNYLLKILRAHDRAFYFGVHLHSNIYRRPASRRASQHPLRRREPVYETVGFIQMVGLLCLGRSGILSLRVPSTELLPAEGALSTIFMLHLLTSVH